MQFKINHLKYLNIKPKFLNNYKDNKGNEISIIKG